MLSVIPIRISWSRLILTAAAHTQPTHTNQCEGYEERRNGGQLWGRLCDVWFCMVQWWANSPCQTQIAATWKAVTRLVFLDVRTCNPGCTGSEVHSQALFSVWHVKNTSTVSLPSLHRGEEHAAQGFKTSYIFKYKITNLVNAMLQFFWSWKKGRQKHKELSKKKKREKDFYFPMRTSFPVKRCEGNIGGKSGLGTGRR